MSEAAAPGDGDVVTLHDDVVVLTRAETDVIAARAPESAHGRARICAHGDAGEPLHEMLIALDASTFVRPHRHRGKTESFHVVEGRLDVVLFDDAGGIEQVVHMSDYASGLAFYYRLNVPRFHTVIVRSDRAVIHETTNGPFDPRETEFAEWAPAEGDAQGRDHFLAELETRLKEHS